MLELERQSSVADPDDRLTVSETVSTPISMQLGASRGGPATLAYYGRQSRIVTALLQVVKAVTSLSISDIFSRDITSAITDSVFAAGHLANSAQPRNLSATSS